MNIKRFISVILLGVMAFSVVSCKTRPVEDPSKSSQGPIEEIDLKIDATIRIPEKVEVDFTPNMGTDKKKYEPSKSVFALKTNRNYAFEDKKCFEFSEYIYNADGVLFAPAEGIAELFGFGYSLSEDKNSAEMTYNNLKVVIKADSDTINVNGTDHAFITTVKQNDALLLAVADFAEAMGYTFKEDSAKKMHYISAEEAEGEVLAEMEKNYQLYEKVVYNYEDVECDQTGVGIYEKSKTEDRMVGIAYSTWHRKKGMWNGDTWSYPLDGKYASDDREVVYRHGVLLAEADVDFVFIDWSNNTGYVPATMRDELEDFRMIEEATNVLFEVWAEIPNAPKICIFVGPGHNGPGSVVRGEHQRKVNQVYKAYIENEKYKDMYFYYEGKPLLMCYGATPTQYGSVPAWLDNRFTIRWVTGFVGQQGSLFDSETLRSMRYWSWEERGAQTYTVHNGVVEAVTCSAATRAQGEEGDEGYIPESRREDGATLKKQFQRAIDLGAKIVLLVSWNEWSKGEQPSEEESKDLEPSIVHGTFYYDLMKEQIKKFKGKI